MSIHLLVVGRRADGNALPQDNEIKMIAAGAATGEGKYNGFVVRRCDSPQDLVSLVRRVAVEYGPIDLLDLFDHGKRGRILMGDALLFDAPLKEEDACVGLDIAAALKPLLTTHAQVRLLGCDVGRGAVGQRLLQKLSVALGGRVVQASLGVITAKAFDDGGFRKRDFEEQYLFSSTDAATSMAPAHVDRVRVLQQWAREQRAKLP